MRADRLTIELMHGARQQIIEWAGGGHLDPARTALALRAADAVPDAAAWRRFLGRIALWLGVLLLGAGVIFFFAYNWDSLSRLQKLALAQCVLIAAVALAVWQGPNRAAGQAALLASALLTGALLAVFGQVYQSGADPYQLFAAWAVLILPWAFASRTTPLWLLALVLANVAVVLYFQRRPMWFGDLFAVLLVVWALFALNTVALVVWEVLARSIKWMRARWARRVLALASGGTASVLAFQAIVGEISLYGSIGPIREGIVVYLAWMGAAYWYYRHVRLDLLVLSAGLFSAVVIIATLMSRWLLSIDFAAPSLALIALTVIGLSAAGAVWLRRIQAQTSP